VWSKLPDSIRPPSIIPFKWMLEKQLWHENDTYIYNYILAEFFVLSKTKNPILLVSIICIMQAVFLYVSSLFKVHSYSFFACYSFLCSGHIQFLCIKSNTINIFLRSVNEYVVQNWTNQIFFHFSLACSTIPTTSTKLSRTVPTVEMPLLGSSSTAQLLW